MDSIKYKQCSFKIDHVLKFTKEQFVSNYKGTDFLKGSKQVQMLEDCYEKCKAIRGVVDPLPASPLNEEDDYITNDEELGYSESL